MYGPSCKTSQSEIWHRTPYLCDLNVLGILSKLAVFTMTSALSTPAWALTSARSQSAHIIKIFIFPSDPTLYGIFHAMNFSKNFFDLDKKHFFLWIVKTLKILFSCGLPVPQKNKKFWQYGHFNESKVDTITWSYPKNSKTKFIHILLQFTPSGSCVVSLAQL